MTRRLGVLITVLAAVAVLSPSVQAFLIFGGATKWKTLPVRFFITNRDVPGVSASQLETAVKLAFSSWTSVPTAAFSAEFVGFTNAEAGEEDDISVIGFRSRPELERVLGQTSFHVDSSTNQLIESDIFLNSSFAWSVAANGESSRFDVQSIATHEVGHLLGLGHSALGETTLIGGGGRRVLGKQAVMFPIAFPAGNINDRQLKPDDVAGISGIYGTADFTRNTGAISGRVRLGSDGVFGAHVTAFNGSTGELIGAFSLDSQGRFTILGLSPGLYLVRVEPLDDADTTSFFQSSANVNLNFKPMYFPRLVPVPAGGASNSIDIQVEAK